MPGTRDCIDDKLREGCGSVILLSDVATLVDGAQVQLEPEGRENPYLAPIGLPSGVNYWWKIVGTAMAFENVGFSRPATQSTSLFLSSLDQC